jgi:hypothetical protein
MYLPEVKELLQSSGIESVVLMGIEVNLRFLKPFI